MKSRMAAALAVVCGCACAAPATIVDLTAPMSAGTINGALFETHDFRSGGTGVISSFVRISGNSGVVQGYNTSGRPLQFDENNSPTFTRNMMFGAIPTAVIEGVAYKEFILDINQFNSQPLLSLDKVEIYTAPTGGQNPASPSGLGMLAYDMDAGGDSWVKLDYQLGTGSGQGDMRMFVPVSAFGPAAPTTFVYVYSMFGQNFANNDGFEEWAVRETDMVPVPLPTSVWAGGLSMAAIVVGRKIRRRRDQL